MSHIFFNLRTNFYKSCTCCLNTHCILNNSDLIRHLRRLLYSHLLSAHKVNIQGPLSIIILSQQTQYVDTVMGRCWTMVVDEVPTR